MIGEEAALANLSMIACMSYMGYGGVVWQEIPCDDPRDGKVISRSPSAGTPITNDTHLTLTFGRHPFWLPLIAGPRPGLLAQGPPRRGRASRSTSCRIAEVHPKNSERIRRTSEGLTYLPGNAPERVLTLSGEARRCDSLTACAHGSLRAKGSKGPSDSLMTATSVGEHHRGRTKGGWSCGTQDLMLVVVSGFSPSSQAVGRWVHARSAADVAA